MKRIPNYRKADYGIEVINPWIIWRTCSICHNEFRSEPMWKIYIKTLWCMYEDENIIHYCCQDCIKNLGEAIEYRSKIIKKFDSPPNPPPSSKKNI